MRYDVTLAMPVYNVSTFVERALLSALNQTFDSIEFLIVDDKGTDNSMDIVRKIKDSHPRGKHIRIIEHPYNIGIGGARNSAIDKATGSYLFFLDSDDEIEPNAIDLLYKEAEDNNLDIVMGSHQEIDGDNVKRRLIFPDTKINHDFAIATWMEETKMLYEIPTWNKLYRLSFLHNNNIKCIPHQKIEDPIFTFKTVFFARRVASISHSTYNYFINRGSHAHRLVSDLYYQEYLEIFEERWKLMSGCKHKTPPVIYSYFLQPFFEFFIPRVIYSDLSKEKKVAFMNRLAIVREKKWQPCSILYKDYGLLFWLVANNHSLLVWYYYKVRPYIKKYILR